MKESNGSSIALRGSGNTESTPKYQKRMTRSVGMLRNVST